MSSQSVDIDADGHKDILVGSFEGAPFLIKGSEDGFSEPEHLTDSNSEVVLISDFWNFDKEQWDSTDRAKSEGHCTSVSAVDWDNDGDLDLILGDYYGGRLYLRKNEGSPSEPKFSTLNVPIEADGEHLVIKKGLAAPRIVDWNGDGLFDILCGGAKGGVYYFKNIGDKAVPEFAAAESLIDPVDDPKESFIRMVPAKDEQPTQPGSSFHIEPVDFDGDGDLDLLVGGRSSWEVTPRVLTDDEQKRFDEIQVEMSSITKQLGELFSDVETDEDAKENAEAEEERLVQSGKLRAALRELSLERRKFDVEPTKSGDFVWLFRRK